MSDLLIMNCTTHMSWLWAFVNSEVWLNLSSHLKVNDTAGFLDTYFSLCQEYLPAHYSFGWRFPEDSEYTSLPLRNFPWPSGRIKLPWLVPRQFPFSILQQHVFTVKLLCIYCVYLPILGNHFLIGRDLLSYMHLQQMAQGLACARFKT